MLVREGPDRDENMDRRLAACLAAVAGAINAAVFYVAGFFSANMTGNVSTLSDHIAIGEWLSASLYFGIVVAFVAGALFSTLVTNAGKRRSIHGIYAYSILLEAMLLGILGCADLWLMTAAGRIPVLVLALAFLMGFQNAVVTRISDARVRTTHISGMATDIGIEIALAFDAFRGKARTTEPVHNWYKLRLHFYTVSSFMVGGVVGVIAYRTIGAYLWIVAALFLSFVSLFGILRAGGRHAGPNDIQ
ncbi:YoaK family protein [Rhizobium sp. PL01]|uniref:YoaK family protein n=1 Tax=Rhizobium sp. PL01 TaxID=3085631 RepID=UPI002980FC43|nr:YoaK family protein [Rhizobium sp. PL01]MDW5317509.1 YoaK family protein [Rhizobium sp. PL01]